MVADKRPVAVVEALPEAVVEALGVVRPRRRTTRTPSVAVVGQVGVEQAERPVLFPPAPARPTVVVVGPDPVKEGPQAFPDRRRTTRRALSGPVVLMVPDVPPLRTTMTGPVELPGVWEEVPPASRRPRTTTRGAAPAREEVFRKA